MQKSKHLPMLFAALLILALVLVVLLLIPSAHTQKNQQVAAAPAAANNNIPAPVSISKITVAGHTYIIVTETTDAGRALLAPTPDKPVYYVAHSMGQRDLGEGYGGAKTIPYSALQNQLAEALATHNYFPSDAEHPPTQVLFLTWGMHNKIDLSYYDAHDATVYENLLSRAKTVGGQKFADEYAEALAKNDMKRFAARDAITQALDYEVWNECHYVLVISLDVSALMRKERKILWTTSISTIPQNRSFAATVPAMIHILSRKAPAKQ